MKLNQQSANQLYNKYCDLGGRQTFKKWLDSELRVWKKSNTNFMDFTDWEARRLNEKQLKSNVKYQTYSANEAPIEDCDYYGDGFTAKDKGMKKTYFLGLTALELTFLTASVFVIGYTIYSNIQARRESRMAHPHPQPQPVMPDLQNV